MNAYDDTGSTIAIGIAFILAYFLPAIVARVRGHHNVNAIAILNFFLGWTVLGWIGSLVWAFTAVRKE